MTLVFKITELPQQSACKYPLKKCVWNCDLLQWSCSMSTGAVAVSECSESFCQRRTCKTSWKRCHLLCQDFRWIRALTWSGLLKDLSRKTEKQGFLLCAQLKHVTSINKRHPPPPPLFTMFQFSLMKCSSPTVSLSAAACTHVSCLT